MPMWLQHLLVLLIVAGCVGVVAWQGVRALIGRRSKLGSCCAKGCETTEQPKKERVVFLPSEMLTSSSRRPRD